MGINWKIVLGKMGETMATREDEYRKFATDYFTKKFETRAEEKRAWNEKTTEQKKEIQKKIDALRAEGLTDVQIANGLNTYKENFFAVVADDLKTFKGSKNYTNLLQQDKTGGKYRDAYRDRFDSLLVTEQQRSLQIEPVVQGLLDKFPEATETPDIAQSIFGFDYTKGIRDDIKGLSKDTNVPDYDAPAGLVGVSDLMSGTIRDVSPTAMYSTSSILNREIVNRIKAIDKFKNLKTEPASGQFRSEAEQDIADLSVFKDAMAAQNRILQKFENFKSSSAYIPPTMEGGETDQQILDRLIQEDSGVSSSAGSKTETGDKTADTTTPVDFGNNVSSFVQSNPQSPVAKLITELQGIDGVDAATLQNILSAIANGKPIRSAIRGLSISGSALNRINSYINNLDADDKATISGFGTTAPQTGEEQSDQSNKQNTVPAGNAPPSPRGPGRVIWDNILGPYFNLDGSPKQAMTPDMIKDLIDEYNQAVIDSQSDDQTKDISA